MSLSRIDRFADGRQKESEAEQNEKGERFEPREHEILCGFTDSNDISRISPSPAARIRLACAFCVTPSILFKITNAYENNHFIFLTFRTTNRSACRPGARRIRCFFVERQEAKIESRRIRSSRPGCGGRPACQRRTYRQAI